MLRKPVRISNHPTFDFCCYYYFRVKDKMKSPHKPAHSEASFPASQAGSATVEAALLTPVFLFAVCSLIAIGQLLIIEGEIRYAAAQTLRICAGKEALKKYGSDDSSGYASARNVFDGIYDEGSLCNIFVVGGKSGISLKLIKSRQEKETLELITTYRLRVPLPVAGSHPMKKRIYMSGRIYSGYVMHGQDPMQKDRIVYVALHGTVYHTRPDCSHICIKITNPAAVSGIRRYSSLKPCAHCIRKGRLLRQVYITAGGDHYHSALSCSGLKRTIRAVPYSTIKGMRKCSRCGSKDH